MNMGVRELRNHTARVIDTLRAGERVTLTVHGLPVVTQDRDFDPIATAHPSLRVIRI